MSREHIVQLDKGGVVAFQEYGDPSGVPVIFCHGWPSSRTMAQLADEPARALGVRIISPDRPGISGSSMQPDRKLSDWPSLVEQLVDNLEHRRIPNSRDLWRRALRVCDGGRDTRTSARDRYRRRSDSICRAEGLQRITAALSLDAGILSQSAATVAAIVFPGATVFVVPRADPASSADIKDAAIAPVRRGQFARRRSF